MNHDDRELIRQLKAAMPPWQEVEPAADLWPRMLRRIGQPAIRFAWFDALLAGLAAASLLVFPHLIPMMLYHL